MGRKNYLGGHTVVGPNSNPYQTASPTPRDGFVEPASGRAQIGRGINPDLYVELTSVGDFVVDGMARAVDRSLQCGTLEPIFDLARHYNRLMFGTYWFRLANEMLHTPRFMRADGRITVVGDGPPAWKRSALLDLHRALLDITRDPLLEHVPRVDRIPKLSNTFYEAVGLDTSQATEADANSGRL